MRKALGRVLQTAKKRADAVARRKLEQEQIAESKSRVRAAANAVHEQRERKLTSLPSLWKEVAARKFEGLGLRLETSADAGQFDAKGCDIPRLLDGSLIAEFLAGKFVGKSLVDYASSYKKAENFEKTGKHQQLVSGSSALKKEHKEFFRDLFGEMFSDPSLVDIGAISDTFKDNAYYVGYATWHNSVGLTPNSCGYVRLLNQGAMEIFLFDFGGLAEYFKDKTTSAKRIYDLVGSLSADAFREMVASGKVSIKHVTQKAGNLLYVPMGYVVAERCTEGPNISGIRKSVFLADCSSNLRAYTLAKHALEQDGNEVSKMGHIERLLEACCEKS